MGFQDIITKIKGIDAADLETLNGLVAKYPNLDTAVAEKAELDRVTADAHKYNSKVQAWDTWAASNFDREKNATTKELEARAEADRLREENAQLTAGLSITGGEVEMTFEEIEAKLKGKYLTPEDLTAKLNGVAQAPDMDNKFKVTEYLFTQITPKTFQFNSEFGRPMSSQEMQNFNAYVSADAERFRNIDKAYEDFTAPMRATKSLDADRAKFEAERAAFETEKAAIEAHKTEAPLPTDNGGGAGIPIFQQMTEKAGENIVDKLRGDIPAGTGQFGAHLGRMIKSGELQIPKPN